MALGDAPEGACLTTTGSWWGHGAHDRVEAGNATLQATGVGVQVLGFLKFESRVAQFPVLVEGSSGCLYWEAFFSGFGTFFGCKRAC